MMRGLIPVPILLLAACGAQQAISDAGAEVARFHDQLDNADYETIWRTSGPQIQSGSKVDFVKFLTAVHTGLGHARESKSIGWNVNTDTSGSYVTVTEQTTFEKGSARETFTFSRGGGH